MHVTLDGNTRFDPRALRAFERSDVFGRARITGTEDEGRRISIDVPLKRSVFLFGTDTNGRDLFTRTLIAGRISLAVGLLASFVALTIGVAYGAVAGYAGGRIDALMMRIVEIVYALPFIFFVIVLVMVFGRHFVLIFVTIGAVEWLDMARIVRGQTLSIKQRDFVAAAEALGASAPAILWRHIIPNASGPISAYLAVLVPRVILLESFVSFLGLGVQEPLTSWGVLVADGARNIQGSVHLLIFPALFLGATLGALQGLGNAWQGSLGAGRDDGRERPASSPGARSSCELRSGVCRQGGELHARTRRNGGDCRRIRFRKDPDRARGAETLAPPRGHHGIGDFRGH